jgi:hypothetical protein
MVALIWRIFLTGAVTQVLVALCADVIICISTIGISNYEYRSFSEVILLSVSLLAAILMWAFYGKSKHRKLAIIDTQLPSAKSLLEKLLRRQSGSEKDKYFALLGIIGDPNTTGLTQQSSIDDIYRQLSLDILRHTASLDMLLYAPGISNSRFANSWIVDWRDCSNVWDVCRWRLTSVERGRIRSLLHSILGETYTPLDMLEQYPGPCVRLISFFLQFCVPLGHALSVNGVIISKLAGSQRPIPFEPIGADSEDTVLLQSVS